MSDDYDMDDLAKTWVLADKLILPKAPTVVVVGAYKGKVMDFLMRRYEDRFTCAMSYCGAIVGYEPQEWAFEAAEKHLNEVHGAKPWELRPYGLSADMVRLGHHPMYGYGTDACSVAELEDPNLNAQRGNGFFVSIQDEFLDEDNGFEHIDLLIMNAEGSEWDLLPELFKPGMSKIDSLAVQFHELDSWIYVNSLLHAVDPRKSILEQVDQHYNREIDQYPSWVYWRAIESDRRDDHHRIVP